jgi:hypothetical protein
MGRHKKERISGSKDGDAVSRKALKDSAVVAWGSEPEAPRFNPLLTVDEKKFELSLAMSLALNWYNAMCDEKNKKAFLIEYCEKFFPDLAQKIKHVPLDYFTCGEGHTRASLARMILRKWSLPQKHIDRLEEMIRYLARGIEIGDDAPVVEKKKARDPKVTECISLVDIQLDDFGFKPRKIFPDLSMADAVLKAGANNGQRTKVHEHFTHLILDLQKAIQGKDDQIKEAYQGNSKAILKKVYDWLTSLPSQEALQTVSTKTRKIRKKKAKTTAQILKNFKCQRFDADLNINSIEPEMIIGAQQLWVFNTKTRRLGVYYAADEKGLIVSRMSIDNYDEAASFNKKIRKPKEVVPSVLTAGKVALRHMLDEIRATKSPMKSRVGETVLVLRATK